MFNYVLSKFDIRKSSGNKHQAICPAHEDHNPSLTITETNDKLILKCHAGCKFEDIVTKVGLRKKDFFLHSKSQPNDSFSNKKVTQYDYYDEHASLAYSLIKTVSNGNRKFSYCQYDKKGKKIWHLSGTKAVPYRLPELIEAVKQRKTIFIPEGEKDVDKLRSIGLEATTNPFGAGKWRSDFNKYFDGANVIILEDNDEAGRNNSELLINELSKVANSIKLIRFTDLPEKGDVSDWINIGHTKEELLELVDSVSNYCQKKYENKIQNNLTPEELQMIRKKVYENAKYPNHEVIVNEILYRHKIKILLDNKRRKNFIYFKDGFWNNMEITDLSFLIKEFLYKNHRKSRIIQEIINSFEYLADILIPIEEMDSKENLINLENTCFNFDTFQPIPHDLGHHFSHKLPYSFNETAKCPLFLQTLKEYSGNDEKWIERLQEIFGYCLMGSFEYQVMFWFYGPKGRNGKGTLIRILTSLLGRKFSLPDFDTKSIAENRFYKSRLKGKRIAVAGDLAKKIYNVNTLKAITGGDEQTSDIKFGEPESFIPKAKIIFAMNSLPRISADENKEPLRSRIIFLTFYKQISNPNSQFEEQLKSELPGIFNWAVEGLKRLKSNQKFTYHHQSEQLLDQFVDDDRPEQIFIKYYLSFDPNYEGEFLRVIFEKYSIFMFNFTNDKFWNRNKLDYVTTVHRLKTLIIEEYPEMQSIKKYSPKFSGSNTFCVNLKFIEGERM